MNDSRCIICGEFVSFGQVICSTCDELNQKKLRARRKEREKEYSQYIHKTKKEGRANTIIKE
jgi:uncharacterized Zn finger protein (UPF0148 family)